jgi:beta-phosphoglucomutase
MITGNVSTFSSVVARKMATKQLLLFDFDGVLIESESFYEELWIKLLEIHKIKFTNEELTGKSNSQFLNQFNFNDIQKEQLLELKTRAEIEYFRAQAMNPQILKWLRNLKSQYKIGIVSNNKWANIQAFLSANNCSYYFEKIISEESGLKSKPAPDSYLAAIDFFKMKKNQVLIIEDSPVGFRAAENAGVDYIAFNYQTIQQSIQSIEIAIG